MKSITGKSHLLRAFWRLNFAVFIAAAFSLWPHNTQGASAEHPMLISARVRNGFLDYRALDEGPDRFKIFALSPRGAVGSWAYYIDAIYDQAVSLAMGHCAEGTDLAGCRLFAVGNTIVWDMSDKELQSVVASYKSQKLTALPIATTARFYRGALSGYHRYKAFTISELQAKVFVLSEDGSWASKFHPTFEEALQDALQTCENFTSRRHGSCRLFAVGDTVVWDMTDGERNEVIASYNSSLDKSRTALVNVVEESQSEITLKTKGSKNELRKTAKLHCEKFGKKSALVSANPTTGHHKFMCY